ncbi:MAG: hypothetical protein AAFZ38_10635 [Myxococcota bacterium]
MSTALPTFTEALLSLRELLPESLRAKDLRWAFREDLGMEQHGPIVFLDSLAGNEALVRELYENARESNGGIAVTCFGVAQGTPCCYVERPANTDQAERLMLPSHGLKLSVMTPLRQIRCVVSFEEVRASNRNWANLGWESVVSRDEVRAEAKHVSSASQLAAQAFETLPSDPRVLIGSESLQELLTAIEYLLPDVLDSQFESWHGGGFDGFLPETARLTEDALEVRGVCILIADQTTTPIELIIRRGRADDTVFVSGRLGKADNHGRMVRVPYGSSAMGKMMSVVGQAPDSIEWVYEFTQGAA